MKTQQFGALKGTKKLENTPEGIRTPNPRFRRPMLYPVELRVLNQC